jgi:hypothetical protein
MKPNVKSRAGDIAQAALEERLDSDTKNSFAENSEVKSLGEVVSALRNHFQSSLASLEDQLRNLNLVVPRAVSCIDRIEDHSEEVNNNLVGGIATLSSRVGWISGIRCVGDQCFVGSAIEVIVDEAGLTLESITNRISIMERHISILASPAARPEGSMTAASNDDDKALSPRSPVVMASDVRVKYDFGREEAFFDSSGSESDKESDSETEEAVAAADDAASNMTNSIDIAELRKYVEEAKNLI